jgi:ABC-type uncharacterized transport system substrate-binding protein
VFVNAVDPVGGGFVASLARPGGNITGFTNFEYGVSGKWLELLKQIAPQVTRAAVLRDPTIPAVIGQLGAIQAVAPALGVEVHPVDLRDAGDVERAVTASVRASNGGLIVTVSSLATIHRAERLICQGQNDALHLEQALALLHQRVPRLREDAGSARRDPRGWPIRAAGQRIRG